MRILNSAFYRFVDLTDLPARRQKLKEVCYGLGLKGTVLLSSEGINACVTGLESQVRSFHEFLKEDGLGEGIDFKESFSSFIPYTRMLVKIKKEIIPVGDETIRPGQDSSYRIAPLELKKWLDEKRDFHLIDTRNDYEIELGTFEKASDLGLRHFRDFQKKLEEKLEVSSEGLSEEEKEKPLVMFCTGGIRCEKASLVAMKSGFKSVYQLDGGILKYFQEAGNSHYRGQCFVFDQRIAVNSKLEPLCKSSPL